MIRVFLSLICFMVLFTAPLFRVHAKGNTVYPTIAFDGKQLSVNAINEGGYTLVPLRAIFEKFGAKVQYNSDSKTIVATKNDLVVTYMIGDHFAYANNKLINLKILPVVKSGVTFIPLRFVAEAFEANILWNGSTNTVIVRSPENNKHPSIAEIRSRWVHPHYYINKAMGLPGEKAIIHLDANPKEQVITLTNVSDTDLDLSNYQLKEFQKNGTYKFPIGFILPAGQNLKISIGSNNGDLNWNVQGILIEGRPNRIDLYAPSTNVSVVMWEG